MSFVTALRLQFQVDASNRRQVELLGLLAEEKINVVAMLKDKQKCFLIVGRSDPMDPTNAEAALRTQSILRKNKFEYRKRPVVEVNLLASVGVPGTFFKISQALYKAKIPLVVTYSGENATSYYDVACCVETAAKVIQNALMQKDHG